MDSRDKPVIVVSAINIFEGGPLSVLKDCLNTLNSSNYDNYEIVAFVHKKELFLSNHFTKVKMIELPKSRKSWILRLYYEYYYFRRISRRIHPFLWLSMHDITPTIDKTTKQCVYCHNPSMFYKSNLSEIYYDKTHVLFSLFYEFLYKINIHRNNIVVVQQDWIRNRFNESFNIPLPKILVAYPQLNSLIKFSASSEVKTATENTFIYAAFPRVHKNYEVIVDAAKILVKKGITNFQIKFTLTGDENRYAKKIYSLSKSIQQITFLGILPKKDLLSEYEKTYALIFPSKLETWGLPITEFKALNKTILLADLEYAHETLGNYDKACFFNPSNPQELAEKLESIITNNVHSVLQTAAHKTPNNPFAKSWDEMLQFMLIH